MTTTDTEFAAAVLESAAAVGSDGLARIDTVYGRSLIVKGASQFRAVRYSQPAPFSL